MALVSIQDIEDTLGRSAEDAAEEAEWQFYINIISDFINNEVDVAFEPQTLVTERLRADAYGEVKLKGPVVNITSVKNFRTQEEDLYVDFDGVDTLYYLNPRQVVDVTYSYGYNTVPDDIRNLVISAILAQINEYAPVSLRSYTVGDVTEEYRTNFIHQILGEGAQKTLDKYSSRTFTINTADTDRFPDYYGGQEYLNDF